MTIPTDGLRLTWLSTMAKAKVYQTTMTMPTGSSTWWAGTEYGAEEIIALYVHDAIELTARHKCEATVESIVWSGVEYASIVELLNGLWARWCWIRVHVKDGYVSAYNYNWEKELSDMEPMILEPTGPTPEYAEHYEWLLQNPALYLLCLKARQLQLWKNALKREGITLPVPIARWLYHTVQRTHGKRRPSETTTDIGSGNTTRDQGDAGVVGVHRHGNGQGS